LKNRNIHTNVKEGTNDNFFIQGISIILQEVNSKWHLSFKLSFTKFRWAWFSCYDKQYNMCNKLGWTWSHCHLTCPMSYKPLYVNCFKPSKQFLGRECNGYKQYVCTKKMHIHYLGEKGIGLLFVPKNYQEWV
jgi:hypothetical protein